jgi:hypothetical protein
MATKLDKLIESIDPSRTFEKVSADVDRAVNTFSTRRTTIEDWDEYQSFFADFYRHVETVALKMSHSGPNDKSFYFSRCSVVLNEAFGPSGYKVAFEFVRTGKDGGLYRVLKTVANLMAEAYAKNEICARVTYFLEGLTFNEKFAAQDEYLRKYGHLLPQEWTEGSAVRLRIQFPKVLEEHPSMIRRMRRIGR